MIDQLDQALAKRENSPLDLFEDVERQLSEVFDRLNASIAQSKARLLVELHDMKVDLIKWMFIFWIGQVWLILGILFAFFK